MNNKYSKMEGYLIDRHMAIGGLLRMLSNDMKRYIVGYIDGINGSKLSSIKGIDKNSGYTGANVNGNKSKVNDESRVVWNINHLTDAVSSLLKLVREIIDNGGYIIVVSGGLDEADNSLVDHLLGGANGVQLINSKWSHGLLSNKESLKLSADQHYKKDIGHSGAAGVASDKRYQSKIMPLRGYLHSETPPQMVIFLNPEDSVDAMSEAANHGVLVAAVCDVSTQRLSKVDYIIPCTRMSTGNTSIMSRDAGSSIGIKPTNKRVKKNIQDKADSIAKLNSVKKFKYVGTSITPFVSLMMLLSGVINTDLSRGRKSV